MFKKIIIFHGRSYCTTPTGKHNEVTDTNYGSETSIIYIGIATVWNRLITGQRLSYMHIGLVWNRLMTNIT